MNILFVYHACHKKTRSADFFLDILREEHIVDCHYYGTYYKCDIPQDKITAADLIFFWEFLPGHFKIAVNGKPCLFVPMYDNEWGSKWQWRRIAKSGMSVLPFCESAAKLPPAQCGGPSDVLRYIAFLLEGIFIRIFK